MAEGTKIQNKRLAFFYDSLLERLVLLLVFVAAISLYPVLNRPWGDVHSYALAIDRHIPFVPLFVLPYLFFFFPWVAGFILWTLARRPRVFIHLVLALLIAVLTSYIFYVAAQSVVVRSAPEGGGILTTMIRWVYRTDARYNAFPSTHTMMTTILLLTTWPMLRQAWKRTVAVLIALSIIAATLLIRQHYVVDVLAGAGIGWIAWRIGTAFSAPDHAQHRGGNSTRREASGSSARQPRRRKAGSRSARGSVRSVARA